MSISSTVEVTNTDTKDSNSQNLELNEANTIQVNSVESSVVSTRPAFQGNKSSTIPDTSSLVSPNLKISNRVNLPGNRPIASSNLQVSRTMSVFGNRPIASNDIDDEGLIGYLD